MMKVRKGFTLVELLIVIVIIGILAAAMMLSSGSATAAAEASNIISDLRSLKAAALMFYADSMELINSSSPAVSLSINMLKTYMDNPNKLGSGYTFVQTTQRWYVGFDATAKLRDVRDKLKDKSGAVGLMGTKDNTGQNAYAGGASWVYMIAR